MNIDKIEQEKKLVRYLVIAACFIIIIAGIKAVAEPLNVLLISTMIAQSVQPLALRLQRYGLSSGLSVLATVIIVLVAGSGLITVIGNSIVEIKHNAPTYALKIDQIRTSLAAFMESRGVDIVIPEPKNSEQVINALKSVAMAVGQLLGNSIFIFILVIVILAELNSIKSKSDKKEYKVGSFMYNFDAINATSSAYIGITAGIGFVQAILYYLICLFCDIDFAATWAILFFFTNFIPVVGYLLAALPMFGMGVLDEGLTTALIALACWQVINIVFDNVIRPKFFNKEFDAPIIVIFVSLMFWSYVLGMAGALLAIPLTFSLKIVIQALMNSKSE